MMARPANFCLIPPRGGVETVVRDERNKQRLIKVANDVRRSSDLSCPRCELQKGFNLGDGVMEWRDKLEVDISSGICHCFLMCY